MHRRLVGVALVVGGLAGIVAAAPADPWSFGRIPGARAPRLLTFAWPGRPREARPLDAWVGPTRTVVELPVHEVADALFLDIDGEVEFERVDVGIEGDSTLGLGLYGVRRARGLYALQRFDRRREVGWVRLVLRSRQPRSRVGVRLGLDD